jgi:hypothetical protein
MNKKLIITEQQYKAIKSYLLETRFDELANKVIKPNDIITIVMNGKEYNFKVFRNDIGRIYMDNIDKNSEYYEKRVFLTSNSFQDDNLMINVAKDDKQKEESPLKGNTWPKTTLKGVEDIKVTRDGDVIDGTAYDEKNKEKKNEFIKTLTSLNEGETLKLELDNNVNLELIFESKDAEKY